MEDLNKLEILRNKFQKELLNWFKNNKRNFLWRKSKNPYDLIIAEIMLQKTNAEKVEKVYPWFLDKIPDFPALFSVSDEELKNILRYLGLQNQKVPILKDLAKRVINEYNNNLPQNKEDLLKIKGIGNYIANAVLCFAFNKRVPIVDGNMIRILERVFNIKSKKKNARTDIEIWEQMEDLLPEEDYKNFNYALLDFAALICTFYNPKCDECFFKRNCYYNSLDNKNKRNK